MELKNVQKSVRLTDKTYQAIMGYRGDGFNEKLGNLVEDFLQKHDALVRDWNLLQSQIADKRDEMRCVQDRACKLREVDTRLGALSAALVGLLDNTMV